MRLPIQTMRPTEGGSTRSAIRASFHDAQNTQKSAASSTSDSLTTFEIPAARALRTACTSPITREARMPVRSPWKNDSDRVWRWA